MGTKKASEILDKKPELNIVDKTIVLDGETYGIRPLTSLAAFYAVAQGNEAAKDVGFENHPILVAQAHRMASIRAGLTKYKGKDPRTETVSVIGRDLKVCPMAIFDEMPETHAVQLHEALLIISNPDEAEVLRANFTIVSAS